jgi:DNA polymerase-3 subunit delta'
MLVSAHADALLPTVQSRCPRLRFHQLGPDDVAAALIKSGKKEAEATAIAALAHGSIGSALDVDADVLVDARDVALRVLMQVAATDDVRRRVEVARELLPQNSAGGAADREHLAVHLRAMATLLRDVELVSVDGDRRALANPDVASSLGRLAAFKGDRGIQAFRAIDEALVAIERNAGVKIVADWVATHM